jgi:hypothetical protein
MKFLRMLLLSGAAIALASVTLADPQEARHGHRPIQGRPASVVVNGAFLGQIDAIVNFCSAANPSAAGGYRAFRGTFTSGIAQDALKGARDRQEYRNALKAMNSMLDNVPRSQRGQACTDLFAPPRK